MYSHNQAFQIPDNPVIQLCSVPPTYRRPQAPRRAAEGRPSAQTPRQDQIRVQVRNPQTHQQSQADRRHLRDQAQARPHPALQEGVLGITLAEMFEGWVVAH